MGKIEEISASKLRRTKLQEAILITIASGGRSGASALLPEIANSTFKLKINSSVRKKEIVRSTAVRLARKGLIKFENNYYHLTNAGEKVMEHWRLTDFKLEKPKKWDGRWRLVIFDIPEKRRKIRDEVRQIFKNAGFIRLQDSVWVYPYDCEDVIGLMKTDFNLGRNMLYIIADEIENDKYLRDEFGLLH